VNTSTRLRLRCHNGQLPQIQVQTPLGAVWDNFGISRDYGLRRKGGIEGAHQLRLKFYMWTLQEAFCKNSTGGEMMTCSVMIASASPSAIATPMGFERVEVQTLLESIQSLLVLHEDINHPIQPFPKLFITDPSRCSGTRPHIPPGYHIEFILCFFEFMDESLRKGVRSIHNSQEPHGSASPPTIPNRAPHPLRAT